MKEAKDEVRKICDKIWQLKPSQIIIDFVQEDVEEALESDETTPDKVGSLCYCCDNLLTIYNPKHADGIDFLTEMSAALIKWRDDAEFVNRALNLDPNK